jgi:hypothetical protein
MALRQEQEQPGFIERWLKRGVDIALGLPRSAINAFNENAQAANDLVTLAAQTPGVFPGGPSVAAAFAQETDPLEIPRIFGEPETFLGGMSEGISRFTLNMIGLGKVLGTAKAVGGVARYGSFVGRAALTDATAMRQRLIRLRSGWPIWLKRMGQTLLSP